jgi:hypothetical protein
MPKRLLDRIRTAVRLGEYDVTKHAVDEMAEDGLDIVDVETAILHGRIVKIEKDDPRGPRHTLHGIAADGSRRSAPLGALQTPADISSSVSFR